MKKVYSGLSILIFLMSCTTEQNPGQEYDTTNNFYKENGIVPFNANNPYETIGQLHDELFTTYYEAEVLPTSIEEICSSVESIANANTTFNNLKEPNYQPLVPAKVEYSVQHQSTCITDIIASSSLSTGAKTNLAVFCKAFVILFDTENNAEILYGYVANYESTIVDNPSFTANDKRILLTTTSVARHSAYLAKKKPKKNTDPDWTILVGNIMAATEGAEENCAKAITLALATGIASNQK